MAPSTQVVRSSLAWVFLPAVVMALGWGLRGYIGGGPFGAMIPGALVTLLLCQYLGYGASAAAAVVAFGALGIGFGGEMTYGQTLGLLRENETLGWGLTGTTLKGAVWGLLGGAMLGLGFIARQISWRNLTLTLVVMLCGGIIGIHWINEPKLIYFSNPVDRPRDESWAGFLCGGLAALAYLRAFQPGLAAIPIHFACYGAVGGAIGFGGGSLLLACQFHLAGAWRWMPFWKYMEFTFGFVFGAALGLCALHLRDRLVLLGSDAADGESASMAPTARRGGLRAGTSCWLMGVLVVWAVFRAWRPVERQLAIAIERLPIGGMEETVARVLLGFTGLGCLLMLLARRWQTVAWQTAISVTIVAAALDWQRDLWSRGKIDMPEPYRLAFVVGMAAISITFVCFWQQGRQPRLTSLFLFALSVLMGIGYLMGLAWSDIWWPNLEAEAAAGGRAAYLWKSLRGEIVVHGIFTTLFLISLWAGLRARNLEN